ncbi:MAG: Asp-tRNA(Asn)/Glu-tRNA(Gln) amidotransferase GatCAB subunit B [Dehalococcoidia bacterium]|nr:Asp-tRNA(Asn)/Glu-tRNA(Gln) amidotransferase GatCAB subunit B [Dehalococcoidia bacterium]
MEYEVVIGLETHVQLKTHSKMWCGCANQYGVEPNTQVCPVCLGMPGVLPVPNAEALRLTALTGFLLNSEVPGKAKFDRKNYFYPDSAKNYQLTQLDMPSTLGGFVEFEMDEKLARVNLTRAHLEEDVGKSTHFADYSGVDFNRAGVPLLEIITEPEILSAEMAFEYLNALKNILQYGGVSDCDMEKGQVRCDVNVSVRPIGQKELGAKIEIKNMNSFSGARRALEYEIPRQISVLNEGGALRQETRRWDDEVGMTEAMRTKEEAHDYRYFPDPDLMPHTPSKEWHEEIRACMVELPLARKRRIVADYRLPPRDADVFVGDVALGDYFEEAVKGVKNPKAVANWVINNLQAKMSESNMVLAEVRFPPTAIGELVDLVESGKISNRIAQEVFMEMFDSGENPGVIVEKNGLLQVSDSGELEQMCCAAIAANPESAHDFRNGKTAALNFLKGQVMKASRGKANPQMVGELLEQILDS